MWHLFVWIPLLALIAAWSLLCWATRAFVSGGWAMGDGEGWLLWMDQWRIPVWLADWLPMDAITALKAAITDVGPFLTDLAASAPELMQWLSPMVFVIWLVGLSALVFAGLVLSVLVEAIVRSTSPSSPPTPGAVR